MLEDYLYINIKSISEFWLTEKTASRPKGCEIKFMDGHTIWCKEDPDHLWNMILRAIQ